MGSLGVPEMIVIFILALVLFGPKKLPEIGRTLGKAITEFRRASSELKETFTTEMQNLERETQSIKEATQDVANQYQYDTYNYDYSSYENQYEAASGSETDSAASNPTPESASAPQGAESQSAETPEGSIARGSENETPKTEEQGGNAESAGDILAQETASVSAEHKA